MRTSTLLCGLAVTLLLAACEQPQNTELRITGDTLVPARFVEVDGVAQSAECRTAFAGNVTGPEGASATIVGGQLAFRRLDGTEQARFDWNRENIKNIWQDTTITSAGGVASLPFGISISLPAPPLEGTATFDYIVEGAEDVRTTAPFLFRCR